MMSLPSLAPTDSYTLWYTSTHSTSHQPHDPLDTPSNGTSTYLHAHQPTTTARRLQAPHRNPLARLRHDEEYMERRKVNIQNYGNSWIKPPGIQKSLHQLREEKREMEEHQEALRREQRAQELAEAEAEAAEELMRGEVGGMNADGWGEGGEVEGDDGGEGEQQRDLDDDVPEAEEIDVSDEEESVDGNEDDEEDEENTTNAGEQEEQVPRGVLANRMTDDVFREAIVRGEEVRDTGFGGEAGEATDEEDQSGMLQEEDLFHETQGGGAMDLDMDVDLDADIPEAERSYEHTDTEVEFSSSEEDSSDDDAPMHPATSMVRSDGTQNSMGSMPYSSSQLGSPRPRRGLGGRRSGQ